MERFSRDASPHLLINNHMGYKRSQQRAEREERIQQALKAISDKSFTSIYAAAQHFDVPRNSLTRRVKNANSQYQPREFGRLLSNAEESTLIRWIKRYTIAGCPATPSLLKELAQLLRTRRVRHASSSHPSPPILRPIGHEWLYRFLNRHKDIESIYARQMQAARYNGASYTTVKQWFDAVAAQIKEYGYKHANIWNMDESGFGIGESQTTKVLIPFRYNQKSKIIGGKQEWVTTIEAINAAGEALPPIIIWKGKHLYSGFISEDTPQDWSFAVSENGWTSNMLGLEWLIQVFERKTREKAAGARRLLIADGHGSHIRADFIAYCMEYDIDLLILPPHCSHILQPLDVGVFAAFKRACAAEADDTFRLSTQRINRFEWLKMFQSARTKAITQENILSGWRGAGLVPSNPIKVLDRLPTTPDPSIRPIFTPPDSSNLDFSLLQSSPPSGTELRESNVKLNQVLAQSSEIPTAARRYVDRVTRMAETQNAELVLLRKRVEDQNTLLNMRKTRKTGKRVKLEGVTVYSTPDVLRVAREAETKPETKRPRGRPRKRPIEEIESDDNDSSSSSIIEVLN
jgi:DDE superfamily endonuclease/Tc5 transposase DNA-binding domain/helix-turn-helix, Psq domain